MPSGKRAKQQRRVAAPPPVRGAGGAGFGARQASPRTLAIAGGVIVLVIVAVVLGIVLSQGSSNANVNGDGASLVLPTGVPAIGSATGPNAFTDAPGVAAMFKGIPQTKFVLGNPNAPVTLVEYIDLQCPVCQSFETTELKPLIDKYVRPGKLKIEMKTWNILDVPDHSIDSLRGQKATIAAAQQNKAFQFAAVLYNNQGIEGTGWLTDGTVSNIAASVDGLDMQRWVTDANSAATASLIKSIDAYANSQPTIFKGTPTLLLAKGNEKPHLYGTGWGTAPMDPVHLAAAIDKLLKK